MSALRDRVRRFLQKPGTADLSGYQRLLPAIAAAEAELADLPDEALPAEAAAAAETETQAGQARFCAVGREAARRALGERPYDAQLLGALVMMSGSVAEMATGEGKTLAGALAAAWHATRGGPVHVMAVNDYLARRDAEWMGPVYQALGVSVGFLGSASATAERRAAYAAQVTYAPVSEIGFDVLRDRLRTDPADQVMTAPDVVLIDEADSVLIDEALVPLVLAGAGEAASTDLRIAGIVRGLRPGRHYEADDEARNVQLTDAGARAAEAALGGIDLYAEAQLDFLTRLNLALHAQVLLRRDVDYIVRDGRIQLISTSRGRVARLQRWPDGLHAAVEAKEGLAASETGEILDSITVESLVRRYPKVCGMTATAVTIGEQLREFYGLEVAVIAPNRPSVREDEPDRLYATRPAKERGVIAEIAAAHAAGRPVLIGTLDIAESERVAAQLAAAELPCVVLNAKNDAEEAAIISEAGARGAITVSTQMAGRGTDIRLGGRQGDEGQVAGLGGLHVVGTGRHWTERIDRQLRGRACRQGDPGRSVFFVSMEDDLVVSYPLHEAPGDPDPDGRLDDARSRRAVRHAQRAAEAREPGDTPQYVPVQQADRGAAARRAGAAGPGAARRRRAHRPGPPLPGPLPGAFGRGRARRARGEHPADRPLPPGPRLGRPPGRAGRDPRGHPPAGARPRSQPVHHGAGSAGRVPRRGGQAVRPPAGADRRALRGDLRGGRHHQRGHRPGCRGPEAADRDLDLRRPGQPVRQRRRARGRRLRGLMHGASG